MAAPTNTRIPYANSSGKFKDNEGLTYDETNKLLTVNTQRIGTFLSTAGSQEAGLYIGTGAGVTASTSVSRRGNVAIGTNAMSSLTAGSNFYDGAYSVAIGYGAMQSATTGGYNTAVGYRAMGNMTTGIQSAAFGYFALRYFTGGSNTAFGYLALQGASGQSTGTENTALGRTALSVCTTGSRNVAVGPCLQALTTGNYNICVGSENFERVTTQTGNTGIGHNAGVYNRGQQNTALGYFALGQLTTDNSGVNASFNTMLGSVAGRYVVTGDYNTYVGYDAGTSNVAEDYDYSTAIGANAKVTESYSFVLGSKTDAERVNYGFGGESYGSGRGVMYIKNAYTNASGAPTDGIIIHAKDSSDGAANGTLALYTEQAVESIGTFTPSHKLKIWINGVEYWIQLDAV